MNNTNLPGISQQHNTPPFFLQEGTRLEVTETRNIWTGRKKTTYRVVADTSKGVRLFWILFVLIALLAGLYFNTT